MSKTTIFVISVLLLTGCGAVFAENPTNSGRIDVDKMINNYRFDPFQWIYSEYFYKAETMDVRKMKRIPPGYQRVKFFDLSAYIPDKYTKTMNETHGIMAFMAKDGSKFLIMKASGDSFDCSEQKRISEMDYCSSYKTPEELFYKLFTLTPDHATTTGEKWIVHAKGREFYDAEKIEIFKSNSFRAFVKKVKASWVEKSGYSHNMTIFHSKTPKECYLDVRWTDSNDDAMNVFLSTLE